MIDALKPGAKLVSVAAMPEPQTALRDLGGRQMLALLFAAASFGIRRRARRAGVTYRYLFMHPSGQDLAAIARWIEQGQMRVVIDRTFAFEEIAEALAYLEGGRAKGKVVVSRSPGATP